MGGLEHFDIRQVVVDMIILILSICVHEFGHAFLADRLGDRLPRRQGRVTLNPLAHVDPIGTLALPLFTLIFAGQIGFAWGKPVMVQPSAMTRKLRMRTAHLFVAAAGPFMNVVFGTFIGFVLFILLTTGVLNLGSEIGANIYQALGRAIYMNCILAFFNLIPAPPLDGGTVVEGLLPDSAIPTWERMKPYLPFVLIAVLLIPQIRLIFTIPAGYLFNGIVRLFGLA